MTFFARLLCVILLLALAACAAPIPSSGTNDPFEAANRAQFDANLRLMGGGDSAPRPNPLRRRVINLGDTLGLPSTIANDVLQLRPHHAVENALRLAINATIGLGGLFDPASRVGVHGRRSDFGETLHRWGIEEGAYLVLPLVGPSNQRDALGMAVDLAIDPLRFVLPSRDYGWSLALRGAGRVASAVENADLLDANVIATADPYAQARLLYQQTRRYHLGIASEDDVIDPYADF